ncbi:MAG TPA: PIN domain-containing protein [Planctomycetota bacterium]|nr:PIN domain-containing protein [Planctomycetota bacterium]
MRHGLRFYLESSFWSRLVDREDPTRRRASRRFLEWLRPRHFVLVSHLVQVELWRTRDAELRSQALRKYENASKRIVTSSSRVIEIAREIIAAGAMTENHLADAFHIAYSVVGRAEALVTWDVGQIARAHTRRIVDEYCWRLGIPAVRLGTPIEVGRWLDVKIE